MSQPTLQMIVSGKRTIKAETALRLGLYFGIEPQFWLNLQADYDLRIAKRAKLHAIEKEFIRWRKRREVLRSAAVSQTSRSRS